MLEEHLSNAEKLYLDRFVRKLSPAQAARRHGVDMHTYISWECGEVVGPDVRVDMEPGLHYAVLRFRCGWTLKELAARIGCDYSSVAKEERGERPLNMVMKFWEGAS